MRITFFWILCFLSILVCFVVINQYSSDMKWQDEPQKYDVKPEDPKHLDPSLAHEEPGTVDTSQMNNQQTELLSIPLSENRVIETVETETSLKIIHSSLIDTTEHEPTLGFPLTIVCNMGGGMGNNLGHFSHCFFLKMWFDKYYSSSVPGRNMTIIINHYGGYDASILQDVFPAFQSYDFALSSSEEYKLLEKQQQELVGSSLDGINTYDPARIDEAMSLFVNLTNSLDLPPGNISMPYFFANRINHNTFFSDMGYDEFRHLFHFNPKYCKLKPDPDETVLVSMVALRQDTVGVFCFDSIFQTSAPNFTHSNPIYSALPKFSYRI